MIEKLVESQILIELLQALPPVIKKGDVNYHLELINDGTWQLQYCTYDKVPLEKKIYVCVNTGREILEVEAIVWLQKCLIEKRIEN